MWTKPAPYASTIIDATRDCTAAMITYNELSSMYLPRVTKGSQVRRAVWWEGQTKGGEREGHVRVEKGQVRDGGQPAANGHLIGGRGEHEHEGHLRVRWRRRRVQGTHTVRR